MPDTFLKLSDVERSVGLGRSWIYRQISLGEFPPPIRLGGASRWSREALDSWMAEKVETLSSD
jgi:prophage regulatory protein